MHYRAGQLDVSHPLAADRAPGDNVDGPGRLNGGTAIAQAVSDNEGRISIILNTSDHASGDNYQIDASMKEDFACGTPACPKSATYTAWKRVYVEVDKMARRGAFITRDVVQNELRIPVSDIRPFPNGRFEVRILHAATVAAALADFTEQRATVVGVEPTAPRRFGQDRAGALLLDPATPLQRPYSGPEVVNGVPRPYLADAVALVTGNRADDYLLPNASLMKPLYDSAFVEHTWLTDATRTDSDLAPDQTRLSFDGVIPHKALFNREDRSEKEWFTRKWIRNADRTGIDRQSKPNHQVLMTAYARYEATSNARDIPRHYGDTEVGDGFNEVWMWIDDINEVGHREFLAEAVVHEMSHQWRVNPPSSTTGGHCDSGLPNNQTRKMFDHPDKSCSMTSGGLLYTSPAAYDNIVGFHYVGSGSAANSEFLTIRRRPEPVPQNDPPHREIPQ